MYSTRLYPEVRSGGLTVIPCMYEYQENQKSIVMTNCKFPGIYKFTNLANGKVYIGQAQNIYKRYCVHRRMKANTLFVRALKKYGFDGFAFEILERVDAPASLDSREQYYLDHYRAYESENGYNVVIVVGSPTKGRKRRPEETRNGLAALKKQRQEQGHSWLGKRHTEETKQLLSDSRKGRRLSDNTYLARLAAHRKPIVQADTSTGDVIRVWDCSAEVVAELGLCKGSLLTACRGGRFSRRDNRIAFKDGVYAGYKWSYLNGDAPKVKTKSPGRSGRAINQLNEATGELIKTWSCIADIVQELGIGRNGIKHACIGKQPNYKKPGSFYPKTTHAGYRWEYEQ